MKRVALSLNTTHYYKSQPIRQLDFASVAGLQQLNRDNLNN